MRKVFITSVLSSLGLVLFAISPAAAEKSIKFNPGHYVAVSENEKVQTIKHLDEKFIKGVNKRYYWSELELEKDKYDFSGVKADLAFLKENNRQLVVFICDKTFGDGKDPVPAYLSKYSFKNTSRGFTSKRWDPVVVERLISLSKAIAGQFDNDPNFEGIAFQESALMLGKGQEKELGYSPEGYRDSLIKILEGADKSFGKSRIFWYMNHIEENDGYLKDVALALVSTKVVMGGPDILPYRKRLAKTYELYDKLRGKLRLFCSAQEDSYRHDRNDSVNVGNIGKKGAKSAPPEGFVPMDDIFLFAKDKLHCDYVFWTYKYRNAVQGEYNFEDAVNTMKKYPDFNR